MSNLYETKPSTIVMYSTTWCPDCRRAKKFLDKKKVDYLDVDIEEDDKGRAFIMGINNGNRVVPTIVFPDGDVLFEPSTKVLKEKLNA